MIESLFWMTAFDVVIVAALVAIMLRVSQMAGPLRISQTNLLLLQCGLATFALFFLADFLLLWVVPLLSSVSQATEWREFLHTELRWAALLITVCLVAVATRSVSRSIRNMQEELERETQERVTTEAEKNRYASQLYQSQKIEALGTLAGGIAHDFNNILTVILNNAEMLKIKQDKKMDTSDSIANIIRSSERAADLVKQILTFSRMESISLRPLDLGKEVESAVKMVRSTIPININIDLEVDKDLYTVLGDATQISQILLNMCTNAYHAIKGDRGTISVSVKNGVGPEHIADGDKPCAKGPGVILTIADDGCGIDPAVLPRIFDPFFTTKDVNKGTGLGLSAVHGIVENHNGNISVESDAEKGTVFSIYFPQTDVESEEYKEQVAPLVIRNGAILLVEDDLEIGNLYRQHLETKGHQVTYCTDGNEALNKFRETPANYDLAITDQAMPELTGKQMAEEILVLRSDIPIILMTGYSDQITEDGARELGITNFLFKPVAFKDLDASVAECLPR